MTETNATKTKVPRHRSPAYPSLSLREAVQKAHAFYTNHGIHPVSAEAAAKGWNFEGVSGMAGRAIAALKQFGLLSEEEENGYRLVRLSDLGRKIVQLSSEDPRRKEAISVAAKNPTIHRDVLESFPTGLPPEDPDLKSYLEYEKRFNRNAIESLIKEIRDTWAFAQLDESGTMSDIRGEDPLLREGHIMMTTATAKPGGTPSPPQIPPPRVEFVELQIPEVGGYTSILRTAMPRSEEELDYLRKVLNSNLDAWREAIARSRRREPDKDS